ncbi:MAG TPA: peptide ABC transporter substrate-binding protein [Micropepsaceae bacterium]|nr:peptide ABC transporter substrate-binding protein [Micropepsaceae bacterium]
MIERQTRRAFLASVCGAALLTACGQSATTPQAQNRPAAAPGEMVLNRGNAAEPLSLDPHHAQGNWEINIIGDLMVGLTTEDADGNPIPGAAERWEESEDGITWTFHLRNHLWSDGQPVTAQDFVFAWRRMLDPKTASNYAYFFYPIKNAEPVNTGKMPGNALGVRAPDDKTLIVELEHPVPFLLQFMMHVTTYPLPRHVVEPKGDAWTKPGSYVSNGPYTLTEWNPNDHVTLVKNPKFYDSANVKIDRAIFYPTTDYEAALKRLRAGELDIQDRMPSQQIGWLRANMPEVLHLNPVLNTEYLVVNQTRKPFEDPRVREALSLAVDRQTIVSKISKVGEVPAYNIVPPGIANYPGGVFLSFKSMPFPERLKRAQELMRQAGYGPDNLLRTSLMIRSAATTARRVPVAVQQMWKQIYVDAQILQLDASIFYNRIQTGDFDVANPAWGADYNDASNFLDLLRTGNSNNYGHYHNAEFDRLLDQAGVELDLTKRGQLLAQAEDQALKDNAWIPINFWVAGALVRPYIEGWKDTVSDTHRTRWLSIDEHARAATVHI